MAPLGKATSFYRQGNAWFCNASLPSDVSLVVDGVEFHLHKFPLISKCGRILKALEDVQGTHVHTSTTRLEEFPGGPDMFLVIVKFCYGNRLEFSPRNIVVVYCAADYLEMTDEYGEGNLLSQSDDYFHENILTNWKDCILALQTCNSMIPRATKLQIISKCLNALSVMVCTDPSLFGWPMRMYGSLQSPGGSILWNGINTGARIHTKSSDWWFEDISYLSVPLFEQLIRTMEIKGIKPEHIAGAIMYYCRKYLPGLGRWQNGKSGTTTRTVASFSMIPVADVDQKGLIETMVKLLPERKGKSFCRFLLGLLRIALILGINHSCQETLERRIGIQLDLATLDSLLIPSYSDSDTLYNTKSVERMICHFISLMPMFSPSSFDSGTQTSSEPLCRVAKLIDNYIAEVASDLNLKPERMRALGEALPDSSRPLHDGLYRALDIYFKAHPWLSEKEREQLCNVINFRKLSIDACAHASQNERLPLRIILQVLFFEQLQLRTALAGCLHVLDSDTANAGGPTGRASDIAMSIVQRDGWVSMVRENEVLKVDLERMRCRVGELEDEFSKMKRELSKVSKSHSQLGSPGFLARKIGCKLGLPRSSGARPDVIESAGPTPRASVEVPRSSRPRKSFSLFGSII